MIAKDVMRKELITAVPEMTVRELTAILLDRRISGVPVVDDGGKPGARRCWRSGRPRAN